MKIGVSGASGHVGRAVVSELLQRPGGHEVVAITRTPETVDGPAQGRFGDYNRPESFAKAYAGLDRLLIISTVDQEPGKRGAQNVAAITPQLFSEVADGVTCNGYGDGVSLLREPDAANPHVRFDERGVKTEAWWE
jgi:putative NADH-flavin reductase